MLGRLLDLENKYCGKIYITGHSPKYLFDENDFKKTGDDIIFQDYGSYPVYPQLCLPFEHFESIVDVLFNTGQDVPCIITGTPRKGTQ